MVLIEKGVILNLSLSILLKNLHLPCNKIRLNNVPSFSMGLADQADIIEKARGVHELSEL